MLHGVTTAMMSLQCTILATFLIMVASDPSHFELRGDRFVLDDRPLQIISGR